MLRHTRQPWELIAFLADTERKATDYLSGIRAAAPIHVEVVRYEPGGSGLSAGLRAACGDYVAVLDERTLVTDGWLDQLLALLESDPGIGAVGPMSNDVAPPQAVPLDQGLSPEALHRFAAEWRREHRGQWLKAETLANSCVLTRREHLARIPLSEVSTPQALAERVRSLGLSLAVARDLFVYRLREDEGAESGAEERWSRRSVFGLAPKGTRVDRPRSPARRHAAPRECLRPGVTLTMIVRDEEANLAECLDLAEGLFDEIVVADTGSADGTQDVARRYGARVVEFPWVDDFAAARNAALDHAATRYAFWLDADDRIDAANWERLRELFQRLADGPEAAYVMRQLSVGGPRLETTTAADHVRLFPVRDDVRWSYRVHEQIVPALRAAGVPVRWTEIGIGHVGYADPRLRDRKLERNLRILKVESRERPNDPFVLFNIGWVALDRRDWKMALGYLRASLAASAPRDSIVPKLYVLIARAYEGLGDLDAALDACEAGEAEGPDNPELVFRKGLVLRERGRLAEAEACWRRVLDMPRPRRFTSVATGIFGHLTWRKLAEVAERRGDMSAAAGLWDEVLRECPGDAEAVQALRRLEGRASDGSRVHE